MSKFDQFASIFKSASKAVYEYTRIDIEKVLVVTDLDEERTRRFADDVHDFLTVVHHHDETTWEHHATDPGEDVSALLEAIEARRPDLICCYRNLHGRARKFPFSLGAHVDVLTQATTTPVLLLPFPTEEDRLSDRCKNTDRVMVLTDHLTGSDKLIDYGARFTATDGHLILAHLEDDAVCQRYLDVIGKIPGLDTDIATERIPAQLLKEPTDYIGTVRRVLEDKLRSIDVEEVIRMGHQVADCKALVDEFSIDLVVMNTKDDEQLAMHGLAYPLAIELRSVPLLML